MKLENNVKPTKRKRGFWEEKASKMKVDSSYWPLTANEYLCLYRAMKNLGFVSRREKTDQGFRIWRDK